MKQRSVPPAYQRATEILTDNKEKSQTSVANKKQIHDTN